jgi:hypothetical protein
MATKCIFLGNFLVSPIQALYYQRLLSVFQNYLAQRKPCRHIITRCLRYSKLLLFSQVFQHQQHEPLYLGSSGMKNSLAREIMSPS